MASYLRDYLASAVSQNLQAYFHGVSEKAVSVALWGGDLELENLTVRRTVLEDLKLPVRLRKIMVAKLSVTVPWGSFGMRPVVLTLSGVHLAAGPLDSGWEWTPEEAAAYELAEKLRAVAKHIAQIERQAALQSSWVSGIATRFLQSTQVRVRDIVLEYVDRRSNPERPFCVGVLLEGLTYGTCEAKPLSSKASVDSDPAPGRFARLDLSNFSIFWDKEDALKRKADVRTVDHDYLLYPTSGAITIEICQPEDQSMPRRFFADVSLERLALTMSDLQLEDLSHLLRAQDDLAQHRFIVLNRPSQSVMEDPRSWWRYAVACVRRALPKAKRSVATVGVGRLLQVQQQYMAVYDASLDARESSTAASPRAAHTDESAEPSKVKELLSDLDRSLPVSAIVAFRRTVLARRSKLRQRSASPKERQDSASATSWLGWLGLYGSPSSNEDGKDDSEGAAQSVLSTSEVRDVVEELFEEDAPKPGGSKSPVRRDQPSQRSTVSVLSVLNEGFVSLRVGSEELVQIIFDGLHTLRAVDDSWDSTLVLGGFQVVDLAAKETCLPSIVLPKPGAENPLVKIGGFMVPKSLEFRVSSKPKAARGRSDVAVDLRIFPFELVYSAPCIQALLQFAGSSRVSRVSSGVGHSINAFRNSQMRALLQAIEARSRVQFSARIEGSKLLIPVDIKDRNRDVLVIDLGDTAVTTIEEPPTEQRGDGHGQLVERRFQHALHWEDRSAAFGETWQAHVADLSVLHFGSLEAYQRHDRVDAQSGGENRGREFLVDHFAIDFTVKVHIPKSATGPGHILLACSLPALRGRLSPESYLAISSIDTGADPSLEPVIEHQSTENDAELLDESFGSAQFQPASHEDELATTRAWLCEARIELNRLVVTVDQAGGALARQRPRAVQEEDEQLAVLELEGFAIEVESFSGSSRLHSSSLTAPPRADTKSTILRFFLASCSVVDCYNKVFRESPEERLRTGFSRLVHCSGDDASGEGVDDFVAFEVLDNGAALTQSHLRIGSCHISWNPETLIELVNFFVGRRRRGEGRRANPDQASTPQSVPSARTPYGTAATKRMTLDAEVRKIRILFNKEHLGQNVAATTISGFKCHARSDDQSMTFSGELANFTLQDLCTPDTRYPELVGLMAGVEESLVSFHFAYDAAARGRGEPGVVVMLTLSPMKFVFLQQLTLELLDYAYEGVLAVLSPQGEGTAGAADESRGNDSAQDGEPLLLRMRMDINRPMLVLPVSYFSEEQFTVDFGAVKIDNEYGEERMRTRGGADEAGLGPGVALVPTNAFRIHAPDLSVVTPCGLQAAKTSLTLEIFYCVGDVREAPSPAVVCRGTFAPFLLSFDEVEYTSFIHLLFDNFCGDFRQLMFRCETLRQYTDWDGWTPPTYQYAEGENTTYLIELSTAEIRVHLRDGGDRESLLGAAIGRETCWKLHRLDPTADTVMELLTVSVDLDGFRRGPSSTAGGAASPLLRSIGTSEDSPELHIVSRMPDAGLYEYGVTIRNLWLWVELVPWQEMFDMLIMYEYSPRIPTRYQRAGTGMQDTPPIQTGDQAELKGDLAELITWTFELSLQQPHLVICPQGVHDEGFLLRADTELKMDYYNADISISNGEFCRVLRLREGEHRFESVLHLVPGPSVLRPTTCAMLSRSALPSVEARGIPERKVRDPSMASEASVRHSQNYSLVDIGPLVITLSYGDVRMLHRIVESLAAQLASDLNTERDGAADTGDAALRADSKRESADPTRSFAHMLQPREAFDAEWDAFTEMRSPDVSKVIFRALMLTFVDDTCVRFEAQQPLLRVEVKPLVCAEERAANSETKPMKRVSVQCGALSVLDLLVNESSDFRRLLTLSKLSSEEVSRASWDESVGHAEAEPSIFGRHSMTLVLRQSRFASAVDLDLSTVGVNWNPNTMVALKEICLRYASERATIKEEKRDSPSQAATDAEAGESKADSTESRKRPPACLGLTLRIEELFAVLNKESQSRRLLHALARDVYVEAGMNLLRPWEREQATSPSPQGLVGSRLLCRVQDIQVKDLCSTTSVYPFVCASEGHLTDSHRSSTSGSRGPSQDWLRIEYESWAECLAEDISSTPESFRRLHVLALPLRFVYYQEFTLELVDYLLAQQIILGIDDLATGELDSRDDGPPPSTGGGFAFDFLASHPNGDIDVRIGSPEVVLPPTSSVSEHVVVHLGAFAALKRPLESLEPTLSVRIPPASPSVEDAREPMSVALSATGTKVFSRIRRVEQGGEAGAELTTRQIVVVGGNFELLCRRGRGKEDAEDVDDSEPPWFLTGTIPDIAITLREDDFALLRDLLNQNVLSGTVHGMELLILRSLTSSLEALARPQEPLAGSQQPPGAARSAEREAKGIADVSEGEPGETFQSPRVKDTASQVRFAYGKRRSAQDLHRTSEKRPTGLKEPSGMVANATIALSRFSVRLLATSQVEGPADGGEVVEPLVDLILESLSLAYACQADGSVQYSFGVEGMALEDSRASVRRPFRQLLTKMLQGTGEGDNPESGQQLYYTAQSRPDGESESAIVLRNLRIFVLPEIIVRAKQFASGSYTGMGEALAKATGGRTRADESLLKTLGIEYGAFDQALANLGTDASWEDRVVIPDVPSTLIKDSRTKLLLHNVEVLLLEKPAEKVTRAISVRGFVHATLRMQSSLNTKTSDDARKVSHDLPTIKREANLHLTEFQVDMLPMLASDEEMARETEASKVLVPELSILNPVDFFLDLTAISAPGESLRLLATSRLGDISLEVSYRDVLLFSSLLKSMHESFAELFGEAKKDEGEVITPLDRASFESHRLLRDRSDELDDASEEAEPRLEADVYDVTFYGDRIGIIFAKHGNLLVIDSFDKGVVLKSSRAASETANALHESVHYLHVGDVLVALQGDSVLRVSYETSISLIRSLARPVTLSFQRNVDAIQTSRRRFEQAAGQHSVAAEIVRLSSPSKLFNRCLGTTESQRGLSVKCAYLINSLFVRESESGHPLQEGSKLVWVNDEHVLDRKASEVWKLLEDIGYPVILRFRSDLDRESRLRLHTDYNSIGLTFLDDSEGRQLPLVRLNVDGKTVYDKDLDLDPKFLSPVDADGDSSKLPDFVQMTGDIRASLSYYNPNIGLWEPLLEEIEVFFAAELRAEKEEAASPQSPASRPAGEGLSRGPSHWAVSVTSLAPVNLNVTEAWMCLFASFLRRWHQDSALNLTTPYLQNEGEGELRLLEGRESSATSGASYSPVYVQNLTGQPMAVFRHDLGNSEYFQHHGKPLLQLSASLEANSEPSPLPVNFGMAKRQGFGLRRDFDHLPTLDLSIEGYHAVERLGLGLSGRFRYDIKERTSSNVDAIIWQLDVVDGRKVVVVRSPLGFRNCMDVKVEVMACFPEEEVVFTSLEPGETCYLPILLARAQNYRVRPEGTAHFSWPIFDEVRGRVDARDGAIFRPSKDRGFALRSFVACEARDEAVDSSFIFLKPFSPDESADGDAVVAPTDLLVHLFASVVIVNNLLEEASVAIWSVGKAHGGNDGVLISKTLAPEEKVHVCSANAALDQLRARVQIRGMTSAAWVDLHDGGDSTNAPRTHRLVVQDGQGTPFGFGLAWEVVASKERHAPLRSQTNAKGLRRDRAVNSTSGAAMPHRIKVSIYPEFILQNLTGLNLIFGQDHYALDGHTGARRRAASIADGGKKSRRQRLRSCGVRMNPWQPGFVEEEVFEVSMQSSSGRPGGWRTVFCTEAGVPLPSPQDFQLPSSDWRWIESSWEVDSVGLADSKGWESRHVHEWTAASRESDAPRHLDPSRWFGTRSKPEIRMFDPRHNLRRRRWHRHRQRKERPASAGPGHAVSAMASAPTDPVLLKFMQDAAETQRKNAAGGAPGVDISWPSMEISPEQSEPIPDVVTFRVRVAGGGYSNSISVTADGTDGAIACPNATTADGHRNFQLAYRVLALENTKVTTIEHRFILQNKTRECLVWRETGLLHGMQTTVQPEASDAVHAEVISLSFADHSEEGKAVGWMWSGEVDLSEIWTFPLRIRRTPPLEGSHEGPNDSTRPWRIVRVSSSLKSSSDTSLPGAIRIVVSEEGDEAGGWPVGPDRSLNEKASPSSGGSGNPGIVASARAGRTGSGLLDAMYILENTTHLPVWYAQEGGKVQHCLNANETVAFGWDNPMQQSAAARSAGQPPDLKPAKSSSLMLRASMLPLAGSGNMRSLPSSTAGSDEPSKSASPTRRLRSASSGGSSSPDAKVEKDRGFSRGRYERLIRLEQIGKTVKLPNPSRSGPSTGGRSPVRDARIPTIFASLIVRGASRIVRFSVRKRGRRSKDRMERATSDGADDADDRALPPTGVLTVQVPTLHISIVDNVPREIALVTLSKVRYEMITNAEESRTSIRAGDLQVDNFLPFSSFPVMVALRDRSAEGRQPTSRAFKIALGVLRGGSSPQSYVHVRQLSFTMAELEVRVDSVAVSTALEFLKRQSLVWADAFPSAGESAKSESADLNYFELLQADRLRMSVSYKNTSADRLRRTSRKVIPALTSALIDMVGRLDGARIRLKPLVVKDFFGPLDFLSEQVSQHYEREARRHVLELIGALHLLGNPIGLMRSFRDGAKDFVAEPMLGLMDSIEQAKPAALVKGFKRGTTSLLKNSVGGVVNSASLLTDMLSNQVSNLTMDQSDRLKHKTRREENERQNSNVLQGLGAGTRSFARSLLEGVSGVVSKPIEGAKSGGAVGLVKGLGHGVVGLVAKPVVGISDAATDVLRGVKGSVDTLNGQKPLEHVRPARAIFGPARQLRPYSIADAEARQLLHRLLGAPTADDCDADLDYNGFVETGAGILVLSFSSILGVNPSGRVVFTVALKTVFVVEIVDRSHDADRAAKDAKFGVVVYTTRKERVPKAGALDEKGTIFVPCDNRARAATVHEALSRAVQVLRGQPLERDG